VWRKVVGIFASGFTFVIKEFFCNDGVIICDCNVNDGDYFLIVVV
jgi:hypothetical protein